MACSWPRSSTPTPARTATPARAFSISQDRRTATFRSQSTFDAEKQALLDRSTDLAARRDAINAEVAQYNTSRDQLIALGAQADDLQQSMDSDLAPPPGVE